MITGKVGIILNTKYVSMKDGSDLCDTKVRMPDWCDINPKWMTDANKPSTIPQEYTNAMDS